MNQLAPVGEQLALDLSVQEQLAPRAERIRGLVDVARGCIIEVGRELIAAKEEIPHGQWLAWLQREFRWHQTTAARYMAVAEAFKSSTVLNLPDLNIDARALYALSGPSIPQEVRDQAVEDAEAGKHITEADVEKLIAEHVAKLSKAHLQFISELREEHAGALQEREDEYLGRIKALKERVKGLTETLDTIENAEPTIEDAVEMFRQLSGKRKLSARQYQALALALGKPISDGRRIYPPATEAESREAETQLAGLTQIIRAMEVFETAPPADQLLSGAPDFAVSAIARLLPTTRQYIERASAMVKGG